MMFWLNFLGAVPNLALLDFYCSIKLQFIYKKELSSRRFSHLWFGTLFIRTKEHPLITLNHVFFLLSFILKNSNSLQRHFFNKFYKHFGFFYIEWRNLKIKKKQKHFLTSIKVR